LDRFRYRVVSSGVEVLALGVLALFVCLFDFFRDILVGNMFVIVGRVELRILV